METGNPYPCNIYKQRKKKIKSGSYKKKKMNAAKQGLQLKET